MHRGDVPGREVLPDRSLGRPVVISEASCPNDATHEVVVDGHYLGSYCEKHDHPSRAVRARKATTRLTYWLHDVHTNERVGQATERLREGRVVDVPFELVDGGVKRLLVIRAYEVDAYGRRIR